MSPERTRSRRSNSDASESDPNRVPGSESDDGILKQVGLRGVSKKDSENDEKYEPEMDHNLHNNEMGHSNNDGTGIYTQTQDAMRESGIVKDEVCSQTEDELSKMKNEIKDKYMTTHGEETQQNEMEKWTHIWNG